PCWGSVRWSSSLQSSAVEQGFDGGVAATQVTIRVQRVTGVPAGQQGLAEPVSGGAVQSAVTVVGGLGAEPFGGVGIEYLAPDVGVVPGVVSAAEGVVEVGGPVSRGHQRVVDPGPVQCLLFEGRHLLDGGGHLLGGELVPGLVQDGCREVLGGGESVA